MSLCVKNEWRLVDTYARGEGGLSWDQGDDWDEG